MTTDLISSFGTFLVGAATLITAVGGFIAIKRKSASTSYEEIERKLIRVQEDFAEHKESVQREFDKMLREHREELSNRDGRHRREMEELDAHHYNEMRDIRISLRQYEGALIAAVDHIGRLESPYVNRGESPPIRPMELQSFINGL